VVIGGASGSGAAAPPRKRADARRNEATLLDAAAQAFVARNPQFVEACLAAEQMLDAALERYAPRDASASLRARIISAAPHERAVAAMWRWLTGAGLGLVLAASCAAGVAAGYTLGHPTVARLMAPAEGDVGELSALSDPPRQPAGG